MAMSNINLAIVCVFVVSFFHLSYGQDSPQDYVNAHNVARSQVGVGPIAWDANLASFAQNYANKHKGDCQLVHSGGPYGENLAGSSGDLSGTAAVNLWVGEKANYDYNSNSCVGGKQCLHYTQVVWHGCDVFVGDWVWDDSYPLYQSKDCRFLDQGFRCSENGRPDLFYTHWRWQPKDCNLPRFDARLMLEKLRNKRLVFVGDSIGRNQWESLLCMLSSAVVNKDSIYEVNGSPITKHKGFLVFKFADYNCTLEYYRSPFLVLQSRPPPGAAQEVGTTLKLDEMDWNSVKWKDADVLVLNTGHWWNYEKTIRGGCYFQEGAEVKMDMKVEHAYQKSMETVIHWIHNELNSSKTQVFFRTYAPVHFRGGDWRNGGNCHLETLPELGSSLVPSDIWAQIKVANAVLSVHSNTSDIMKFQVLNVTHMTARRKDGHASLYYLGPDTGPAPIHRQDCSHWCLPGVPDAWNELLYAVFLKHEATRSWNSSQSQAQV